MDDATIGARLRILRRWRGMSQARLAGLAGMAPSYLSMIENGQRSLDRRSYIAAISAALRVSETDLVGGPHLSADREQADPHTGIPALREALQANRLGSAVVDRARPLADLAAIVAEHARPVRSMQARYTEVGAFLPAVIDELHWHAASPHDEQARRLALESLIEAWIIAGLAAHDLCYLDLAYGSALRAEEAAKLLDDPVQRGKAECLRLWAFPRERSWTRRLTVAQQAAEALEPHARSPLGLHVLGILTLHAALSAAVTSHSTADHWLAESAGIATRVPDDPEDNWQAFSATNVRLWGVTIGIERGDSGGAVMSLARDVNQSKITLRTRRAMFLADIGRGLAREQQTRLDAVRWLRQAEDAAPQLIRNHPPTREAVAFLLQRSRAEAGGRELRGMAARMGVPH